MTLLEDWQAKPSWKETFPLVPTYYSMATGIMDLDLRNVIRNEPEVKLNLDSTSGIEGIAVGRAAYSSRVEDECIVPETINGIAQQLINYLCEYFDKLWDPKVFHLIFCSGGRDSRILAWTLKMLYDGGKDLGEFKFICHQPEQDLFLQSMVEMGWSPNDYAVWKIGAIDQPDYYEIDGMDHNINAFTGPRIRFFEADYEKTCLVSGSFGGELTDYPTYRDQKGMSLELLYNYAQCPALYLSEEYYHWKDILMPYLSYDYLNLIFNLPGKHFQKTGEYAVGAGGGGDMIRDTMLAFFPDTIPYYYGHSYNLDMSIKKMNWIEQQYRKSKFYEKFFDVDPVRNASPAANIFRRKMLDTKLYGLATVFEGIK